MFEGFEKRFSPYGIKHDPADLPATLYHYTDATGLVGMLSSNKIWATEYRFLNDHSEVRHTLVLVRSMIIKRMKQAPSQDMSALYSAILEKLDQPADNEMCVFSLSEEADSLSQWRGYARDGQGFTVGFDVSALVAEAEKDDACYAFAKVEYDETKQERGLLAALKEIERIAAAEIAKDQSGKKKIIAEAADQFEIVLWNRAVINKHSSFASEREWRIASFALGSRDSVKVRSRANGLVPYMELDSEELASMDKLPIIEIGIGPGFSAQDQIPAVRALCRHHGHKVRTYMANAPYRSM